MPRVHEAEKPVAFVPISARFVTRAKPRRVSTGIRLGKVPGCGKGRALACDHEQVWASLVLLLFGAAAGVTATREKVLARAAGLAPEFRSRAGEGEANRTMPDVGGLTAHRASQLLLATDGVRQHDVSTESMR